MAVVDHRTGRHIRDEPGLPRPAVIDTFENYRAGEEPRKVWVTRPEPQPESTSDPNAGLFDGPA